MLLVERSNRTERLLEGLARRLMAPGRDPLASGVVVVQGPGMERWIAQSIARDYGVCANIRFPFPREFLERVFRSLPDASLSRPNPAWEVRNLTWRIAKRLVEGRDEPDFAPLGRQLHAVDGDWRLVQLAHRIADLLDRYITFRPDWASSWIESPALPEARNERWQARLFRSLHAECGGGHVADRALAFHRAVTSEDPGALAERLRLEFPDVIEIFAVSALPPLYLSVINDLARLRDVRLSVLSPSRHYWADLWREVKDEGARGPEVRGEGAGLFEGGAPSPAATLLAGLGRLGSDLQRNLEEHPEIQDGDVDLFETPGGSSKTPSLLARFQTRLLELDETDSGASRPIISREDDSVRIHVCHGPRRELEVVEAVLRDAFERDASLAPEDVIVMAPDIDAIAPDIEAVFGTSVDEPHGIPFRIADRGIFHRSVVAEAARGLLELLRGRATRSEVLDWLAREPVRARFGLDEDSVERLAEWAERAGVRFGVDEEHRERLGLSRERRHSLRGGLDRLALAHAVGPRDEVFAGVSPTPLDALADPHCLGAIGDVESILSESIRAIAQPRSVVSWCSWLASLFDRTLERTDANAHEHAAVRSVLRDLATASEEAGFEDAIPFDAIRERVCEAIEAVPTPEPFLSGGVTFCELVPLRAIPFRVVVLLGMCDEAFPRGGPAPGFDLIAQAPRPGDRTTRTDDRYLFLEALISARDQLVVTLPGYDTRDGSRLPPSVVVSDLLDALDALFVLEPGEAESDDLREWLVVPHRLHASSPVYFERDGDPRLLGRDEEAFKGALARRSASDDVGAVPRRFLSVPPSGLARHAIESTPILSLDAMVERFLRSTRWFSRDQLRLRLPRPEAATEDLDPVDLDPLQRYGLGNALLEQLRSGLDPQDAARRLMANASMPVGVPGRLSANALLAEAREMARICDARCSGERLADLDFELELEEVAGLGTCRIGGRLDQLWTGGRIEVGFSKIGGRAELELWIRHLVLCALVEGGSPDAARSVFVGRPESKRSDARVVVFQRVAEARSHLARLFEWAWSSEVAPLPFFPKSSWAFASAAIAGKSDQAWRAAHQKFEGGDMRNLFAPPESEEELETARIWEGWSPLESKGLVPVLHPFDGLAKAFFAPLIAAREVQRE